MSIGRTNCSVQVIGNPKVVPVQNFSWTEFLYAGGTYYHNVTFTDLKVGELYVIAYNLNALGSIVNSYVTDGGAGTGEDESMKLGGGADSFINIFRATASSMTKRFQYYKGGGNGNISPIGILGLVTEKNT